MVTLNSTLISLVILFLAGNVRGASKIDKNECEKGIAEIDRLVKLCLHMAKEDVKPTNETYVDIHCRPLKSLPRAIRKQVPCEDKFRAQLLRIVSNSLKKPIQYVCKDKRQVSMKYYKCFSDEFLGNMNIAQSKFIDLLQDMEDEPSSESSLPKFCCTVNWLLEELPGLKGSSCDNSVTNAGRFLKNRVDSAVSDILDLICSPYRTYKTCQEKVPQFVEIIETRKPGKVDLSRNFVKKLLKILGKLANQ